MNHVIAEHRAFWNRERFGSLAVGALFLVASLYITARAGHRSAQKALTSNFVHDAILDFLPVVDLSFIIVQGAAALIAIGAILFLIRPRQMLFGLKAVALFLLVRALFINLTNIGIYPDEELLNAAAMSATGPTFRNVLGIQGDYFFSGHTGLPLMIALIFWSFRRTRIFFLAMSAVNAAAVLFAHVHYSIDVFAAPFITYGIFRIAEQLFPHDYALIHTRSDLSTGT